MDNPAESVHNASGLGILIADGSIVVAPLEETGTIKKNETTPCDEEGTPLALFPTKKLLKYADRMHK